MTDPSLKLLVLKTDQVEKTRRFYAGLGFVFKEERHGNGTLHFSAPLGDGIIEIYPLTDAVAADTTTRLGFTVADVDAVVEVAGELGQIVSKPRQTEWGRQAVIRDPDGRSVELYESSHSRER